MTDFLGGIVARSLSRVESVQPRLPSIFEPVRAVGYRPSEAIESWKFREVIPLSKPDVDTRFERQAQLVRNHGLNSFNIQNFSIVEKSHQHITLPSRVNINEERRDPDKINFLEAHPNSLDLGSSSEKPKFLIPKSMAVSYDSIRDKETARHDNPVYQNVGRVESNSRIVPRETNRSDPSNQSINDINLSSRIVPGEIKRSNPSNQSTNNVNISSRFVPLAIKRSGSENKTEQAPVVRVNIGRIDVRAVIAEPMKQRKMNAPTAPTLSLEDYMKQRNGGLR